MKLTRAWQYGAIVILLASSSLSQEVKMPWEVPCSEERVQPNFQLKEGQVFRGELKDQSGAPLAESQVTLRRLDSSGKFAAYRTVTTNNQGRFELGMVEAGKYRFLPSPHRGFKQPKEVTCPDGRDCEVKLVLQVNPTDQVFGGCPIQ